MQFWPFCLQVQRWNFLCSFDLYVFKYTSGSLYVAATSSQVCALNLIVIKFTCWYSWLCPFKGHLDLSKFATYAGPFFTFLHPVRPAIWLLSTHCDHCQLLLFELISGESLRQGNQIELAALLALSDHRVCVWVLPWWLELVLFLIAGLHGTLVYVSGKYGWRSGRSKCTQERELPTVSFASVVATPGKQQHQKASFSQQRVSTGDRQLFDLAEAQTPQGVLLLILQPTHHTLDLTMVSYHVSCWALVSYVSTSSMSKAHTFERVPPSLIKAWLACRLPWKASLLPALYRGCSL